MREPITAVMKAVLSIVLAVTVLAGCGGGGTAASGYPLESVTQDGNQSSRVYRAENQTVPEVAKELAAQRTPKEVSKEDADRMFLVYSDELYHLQKDPQKPGDTLIEVDNNEFVRQNYNPSFFQGFILATLLGDLFDSSKRYPGSYRGYTSKEIYKPRAEYHPPTSQEKKAAPPLTKQGSGTIIKRGDGKDSTTVGSKGSIFTKDNASSSGSGKIIKSSNGSSSNVTPKKSSIFSKPRSNSPPKTRVGGLGRIGRRR